MWSFIRTILLLLVASFIVAAEFNITAQMIGPDGKVVHLDPNRDFTPFTRHHHHHNHRLQSERLGSSNSDALFSFNWCGAVANSDSSDNTSWIEAVEGRFIVPTMETNSTLKAAQQVVAFVGLDGYSCRTGFLQGGVWSTVDNTGNQTNKVFWTWMPLQSGFLDILEVLHGDEIYIALTPSLDMEKARWRGAEIIVENVSSNNMVMVQFSGPDDPLDGKLCGQDAEWIVQDPRISFTDSSWGEFADFAPVKFFLANAQLKNDTLSQDVFLMNMTSRIYLRGDDEVVTCTAEYSDDAADVYRSMFLNREH